MTTIPNLNVVIQQGGAAREVQNIKAHTQDVSQTIAVQQPAKEIIKQTTVQNTDHSDHVQADQEKAFAGQTRKRKKKRDEQEADDRENEDHFDPEAPGQLLDTKA